MELPILKLAENAVIPTRGHPGDAGLDLYSIEPAHLGPGERWSVGTGIAVEIPDGYAGLVLPRSGLAREHGITLVNSPGLIDSGYRDELAVILINTDPHHPFEVHRGDRIAQLVIQRVEAAAFTEVDDLPVSERGLGGFGHTGR